MKDRIRLAILILLVILCVLCLRKLVHAQGIDPNSIPPTPPIERPSLPQPPPLVELDIPTGAKRVQYGCAIDPIEYSMQTYNAKTKKLEMITNRVEYDLRLWLRLKDGKELWHFEPAPYSDEDQAFADCRAWRSVLRKTLASTSTTSNSSK